jgi:alkylation response protein AidB-like acyl-CoA dehydrogenase
MAVIRPRDLLTDDLLKRLGGNQIPGGTASDVAVLSGLSPVSGRLGLSSSETAAVLTRDIDRLRDVGYLNVALPPEFGGLGCTLRQAACGQRQLTYRSPLTALAVASHLYWTGAAADAYRLGDMSAKWILLEAARGALFSGGHGLPGADLQFADPQSRCVSSGESGYRFRSPGVLAGLTPGWDWMAVHAVTSPLGSSAAGSSAGGSSAGGSSSAGRPEAVLAFAGRGSRCTPSYRVCRVLPAGSPADVFTISAMGWGFSLISSIQYSFARSAFNEAVRRVSKSAPTGAAHPLDKWPVAEASLRLDTIKSRIADVTHVWLPHAGRAADPGGRELIKVLTMRHEVANGARRVLDLVAQISDAPADSAPATIAR